MRLTLRLRILLTLVPLLLLLLVLGGAGAVLLYRLGNSIGEILRENYASVIAMVQLNEAVERIDSSFQFALAGKENKAVHQYNENWQSYRAHLKIEQENITLPGEGDLVRRLEQLTDAYSRQGDQFYALPANDPRRRQLYFGGPKSEGLLQTFEQIKRVSGEIRRINQENMEEASRKSKALATNSLYGFGAGLVVAVVLAGLLTLHTIRWILQPLRAMTESALAVGRGDLDQVIPVPSRDELGDLAEAFNTMTRQLRLYRQTDYSRLLRAQRTSQATIDSFPDPVLVVDVEGRVEMANPAARRLLGVSPGEKGDGRADSAAAPPWHAPDALREPLEAALRRQRDFLPEGFGQAVPLRQAGQDHLFLPRILSIRDPYGGTLGAAVVLQDVTRFQLLDQVKSNMLATVSHELKTPLTSIRLAVHLLLEETVGSLTPKQTELLVDARDNAERLLSTINHLLDLARLENGHEWLEFHPESPAALLREAAEAIRPRAQDKGLEVRVEAADDLPAVNVDGGRFALALANLLDNAVTYTAAGGHITLSAGAAGGAVTLAVADTGVGIPPEHLPHVFERFFRVPGQSRVAGTGLGLAIVHEIVTAHDGTIACESRPGEGTVFRITLPVASGTPASETALGRARATPGGVA